jgi:ribosomal protein L7Ae-like RNA K-turn-binding protein
MIALIEQFCSRLTKLISSIINTGNKIGGKKLMVKDTSGNSKKKLPIITCECGTEIVLIDQVEVLGRAIDIHIEEHTAKVSDPVKARVVAKHIEDYLVKQVLDKASNY